MSVEKMRKDHPGLELRQWCLERNLVAEAIVLNQQSIQKSMLDHFFELGNSEFSGRYFDDQQTAKGWLQQTLNATVKNHTL